MPDRWITKREKSSFRKKQSWLVNLGLVFVYSVFLTGCFFISVLYAGIRGWGWTSFVLVFLASALVDYVLNDFRRALLIFLASSLVGSALIYFTSDAFIFHSSTSYGIEIAEGDIWVLSPAYLISSLVIVFFLLSIVGAATGYAAAEWTGKGEKPFTLRCAGCGTWNERDALKCSSCGRELIQERYAAEKECAR
jgi:hypothetical protein